MKLIRTLAALLLAVVFLCAPAIATEATEEPMSFEAFLSVATAADLLHLREELDSAIRASDVWESVNIHAGLYEVGVDIPAGKWTVEAGTATGTSCSLTVGNVLTESGKEIDTDRSDMSCIVNLRNGFLYDQVPIMREEIDIIELPEGYYVEISYGNIIFTPYYGKPNFDFYFYTATPFDTEVIHTFPLDGLAYDELIVLKDQMNLAIWNSYDWASVLVPYGIYEVGVDIPVGYWDIRPPLNSMVGVHYGDTLSDNAMAPSIQAPEKYGVIYSDQYTFYDQGDLTKMTVNAEESFYIDVWTGVYAWFSTHEEGPDFGFEVLN